VGREWRTIREELDRVLLRKNELAKVQDLAIDAATRDGSWKIFVLVAYGIMSAPKIALRLQTWRIVQKIPGQRKPATVGAAIPYRQTSRVVGQYQKRKFKPTPITLALVLKEPINVPADGLLE
jgi:hypothetical protein